MFLEEIWGGPHNFMIKYRLYRQIADGQFVGRKENVKKPGIYLYLSAFLLVLGGISAQTSTPTISPVPNQVKTLLRRRCTECHKGENPPRGLNLESGRITAAIDAESKEKPPLKIIDSANPTESYILKKLRGDADIVGSRMPLNEKALTPAEIEILKTWIFGLKKDKDPAVNKNLARGGKS